MKYVWRSLKFGGLAVGAIVAIALVTVGVSAVAVFAAHRMVQPLVLLENAVQSVGPDAILPVLPEKGPAEVRATARALNSLSSRLRSAIESRIRERAGIRRYPVRRRSHAAWRSTGRSWRAHGRCR